jgi:predicted XRE-type DNA-binding protein
MRAIKFLATTFRDRDRCLNQDHNKLIELNSLHFIEAHALLESWPESYHNLLETMIVKKQNGEIMLHGAFNNHYKTLIAWRHAEVLSPFWDYLRHFLEKRKRMQILTGRGQPVVQQYMNEPAYISQARAAQHLTISKRKVKTLVENGQLVSKKFETGYGTRAWLCLTSVEEYNIRKWDVFTQNSAAAELGIAKATVVSLLKAKILKHAVNPEDGDIALSQRITGESVRGLAQNLNNITIARIPGEGAPIPLIKAPHLYNANGISLAVIIYAVMLSRIRIWVTDVRHKPHLHNFEISEEDLRNFASLRV